MHLITFSEEGLSPAEYAERNKRFHHIIGESAHNQYLDNYLCFLQESLILLGSTTFQQNERADKAAKRHKEIIDAIVARNFDRAEETARNHIREAFSVRLQLKGN